MPRFAYVNGRYVRHRDAAVHIEDRGFQFADGVYEVVAIQNRRPVDQVGHLDRLDRSLNELQISWPMSRTALELVMRTLLQRNAIVDGIIYLQITRGVAPRDFRFPKAATPTMVMTTRQMNLSPAGRMENGVNVVTIPDIRWKRRDIKSVALLPQALGKQQAAEAGAFEAWQVDDDGSVTEGCSSNAWIVTQDDVLVTRQASTRILNGITRLSILRLAEEAGITFEERPFTVEEAQSAKEAFLSSATTYVTPVTRINEQPVGDGRPGPLAKRLRQAYWAYASGDNAEV
ncbi:MAG: D-amino-acid transaminase [Pseudomonadota bacterium]